MAVRQATYKFADLSSFLNTYDQHISKGSMFFNAGEIDKDVANEFKLDLVAPIIGRQGPILAQVVHRGPDGSIGVHLPDIPGSVADAFTSLFGFIGEVKDCLIASKQVVMRTDYNVVVKKLAVAETSQASPNAKPTKRTERGFPIPDTSRLKALVDGKMSDRSLRDAMVGLAVESTTGLLTIKCPNGTTRYGYWLRGGVVGWRTEPMNEDEVLGVLLFKAGQITADQIKASLEIMTEEGLRQGEALVQMGLLDFSTLIRVLGKQTEFILKNVLESKKGTWQFHVLPRLPEQFMSSQVNVPSLLFRALFAHARTMSPVEISKRIEPNLDRYLAIAVEANPILSEMSLTTKEKGLITVIQSNSWRLREVFSVSPLSKSLTSAFIWRLDELALLTMADKEDMSRTKARIADRLNRKKKQLQSGNYFDILEIHWVCLGSEVQSAYTRIKAEFARERFEIMDEAQEELLERIVIRIDEAFAELEADSSRRKYRATVIEKDAIINSAEMLGRQGEMGIMRRDRPAACAAFAKAAELDPRQSKFLDGMRRATTI